jgi:hypothetical protein
MHISDCSKQLNDTINSKWLVFVYFSQSTSGVTSVWQVVHKDGTELGLIEWFFKWRQYIFNPEIGVIFSPGCMNDIAAFCVRLRQLELQLKKGQADDKPPSYDCRTCRKVKRCLQAGPPILKGKWTDCPRWA